MFRPTHFVILFAVFLCAYAAPSAPATSVASASSAVEPAVKAVETKKVEGKGDLATDATTHLLYSYGYGPSVYSYPTASWLGRSYGFDYGRLIDPLHPNTYLNAAPLIF